MPKLVIVLGASVFALGASAMAVQPTGRPGLAAAQTEEKAAPKKSAAAARAAPKRQVATYKRRCKAGRRWHATATASAGACETISKPKTKAQSP